MDLEAAPTFLYQSVHFNVDMAEEMIKGNSMIWVAYKMGIAAGDVLNLHCRQCNIVDVSCHDF